MHTIHKTGAGEEGFILVLALFMLTICTIIGMAAMMTSTMEIDIAGNGKVSKETFYQAETGYVPAAAAIMDREAYGEWANNYKFTDLGVAGSIVIKHGDFLLDGRVDYPASSGRWNRNHLPKTVVTDPDIELRLKDQFNGDVVVDKVDVRYIAGSGAEFGSGAEGMGVASHKIIYNMDCLGTLPGRQLRSADGTLSSGIPLSEVVLGYRYVLR
jgi:hypothetical protein